MTKKQTKDIALLQKATLFSLTLHNWGNRRMVRSGELASVKGAVRATKQLVVCQELQDITDYQNSVKHWTEAYCRPSYIVEGVYWMDKSVTELVNDTLKAANDKVKDELLPKFLAVYEQCKLDMRKPIEDGGLGELWHAEDYPSADQLRIKFGIDHSFVSFGVPDGLPEKVHAEATAKMRKNIEEAEVKMITGFRMEFGKLVEHLVDRITPDANGKQKVFHDSMLEGFSAFFESFKHCNFANDRDLAKQVELCESVLSGVTPNELRKSKDVAKQIAKQFGEVKTTVTKLISEKPDRAFDWGE